ncbi:MAG: HupE/UreJ family protein [Pseudomonadota bacterium]
MKDRAHRLILFGPTVLGLAAYLLPSLAHAHVGVGDTAGFAHGVGHPLGGVDHILAMVAVGLWAAQCGGRALWFIPATFVLVMGFGGFVGTIGLPVPFVEQGIVLSVLVLGVLVAAAVRLPLFAGALIVALFAVFHGHAHGAEMPANALGLAYGAGFALATAILHALGIGAAVLTRSFGQSGLLRVTGGAIAMSGVYLWLAA